MCLLILLIFQTSEDDVSQFDTRFTLQTPIDSPDESTLSESANLMFQVFAINICLASSLTTVFLLPKWHHVSSLRQN